MAYQAVRNHAKVGVHRLLVHVGEFKRLTGSSGDSETFLIDNFFLHCDMAVLA